MVVLVKLTKRFRHSSVHGQQKRQNRASPNTTPYMSSMLGYRQTIGSIPFRNGELGRNRARIAKPPSIQREGIPGEQHPIGRRDKPTANARGDFTPSPAVMSSRYHAFVQASAGAGRSSARSTGGVIGACVWLVDLQDSGSHRSARGAGWTGRAPDCWVA